MSNELDSWFELMQREEELLPELQAYYEEGGSFPMVRHPLVFSVPHSPQQNAMVNQRYRHNLAAVHKAYNECNFGSYIALHERPYRIDAFKEYIERVNVSGEEYWSTLAEIYTDSENIYQNFDAWFDLLSSHRSDRERLMSEDEAKRLNSLGNSVTIYRGYKFHNTNKWLSWSLNYKKAKFFADRFVADGHVACVIVQKSDIIAYFNSRDEDEVLISIDDIDVESILMRVGE